MFKDLLFWDDGASIASVSDVHMGCAQARNWASPIACPVHQIYTSHCLKCIMFSELGRCEAAECRLRTEHTGHLAELCATHVQTKQIWLQPVRREFPVYCTANRMLLLWASITNDAAVRPDHVLEGFSP